jgi:hypothetical protein
LRPLCDHVVAELAELVSDLVVDLERSGPILVCVGRDQTESALRGLKQQT